MYGAVLPSYESAKDKRNKNKSKDAEGTVKVDDPKNKDQVKKIFDSFD